MLNLIGSLFSSLTGSSVAGGVVLTTTAIRTSPERDSDVLIDLDGRAAGLISWLLSFLGLPNRARLYVSSDEVRVESRTLTGWEISSAPLSKVSGVKIGSLDPVLLKYAAIVVPVGMTLIGLVNWTMSSDSSFSQFFYVLISGAVVGAVIQGIYKNIQKHYLYIFSESLTMGITVESSGGRFNEQSATTVLRSIRDMILGRAVSGGVGSSGASDFVENDFHSLEDIGVRHEEDPDFVNADEMDSLEEDAARDLLRQAKHLNQQGDRSGTIQILRRIVEEYPQTEAARTARKSLDQL